MSGGRVHRGEDGGRRRRQSSFVMMSLIIVFSAHALLAVTTTVVAFAPLQQRRQQPPPIQLHPVAVNDPFNRANRHRLVASGNTKQRHGLLLLASPPPSPSSRLSTCWKPSVSRIATTTATQRYMSSLSAASRSSGSSLGSSEIQEKQQRGQQEEEEEVNTPGNGSDTVAATATTASSESQQQEQEQQQHQQQSVLAGTVSLIKAMIGAGVLALPFGLASASDYPRRALWPANALLLVLSALSAYTFHLYGRLTHATNDNDNNNNSPAARSLGDLWERIMSGSNGNTDNNNSVERKKSSIPIVSLANLIYCAGCCLTFSLILGDALSSLAGAAAAGATGPLSWLAHRRAAILAVTVTTIFPLCNLSSLAALAPFSTVGVLGSLATTIFLAWRCPGVMTSNSPYAVIPATATAGSSLSRRALHPFLESLPDTHRPSFGSYHRMTSSLSPLILIAMGCVALMAHFSAPDFYHSLNAAPSPAPSSKEEASSEIASGKEEIDADSFSNSNGQVNVNSRSSTNSLPAAAAAAAEKNRVDNDNDVLKKFTVMTVAGYAAVAILDAMTLTFGFCTFGGNCQGIILNNYAAADWGAVLSRCLVILSVTGGYPFLFGAFRQAFCEICMTKKRRLSSNMTAALRTRVTAGLLAALTAVALVVKDAGFVVSFNGALMGTAIIYIFPALLFLRHTASSSGGSVNNNKDGTMTKNNNNSRLVALRLERLFCRFLVGFGVVSGVIGGAVSVMNSYFPQFLR